MDVGTRSEVGLVRERNEDALLASVERGLFVVADGMGGHPAGDVASRVAIDSLEHDLADLDRCEAHEGDLLSSALLEAHRSIQDNSREHPDRRGMGTTAVVAHVCEDETQAWIAHVGDSRAYLVHDGDLRQLTDDHAAGGLFGAGRITQALGGGDISPDVDLVELASGDRLVLCTDGLTNMLSDDDIAAILDHGADDGADDPQEACDRLVKAAISAGGVDNVTVIVVDVDPS